MALETFNFVDSLSPTNPAPTDSVTNGAAHMRGIKLTLKQTFPGATGPLTTAKGGHLSIDDGTATAPAFTFTSEPSLGFYRSAAGTIACSGTFLGGKFIGEIFDYAGANPPPGCLACDGQALSRTTYADLFSIIGTTWGAGDGSTTFNLPGLMARFRRHRDNSTLSGAVGNKQNPTNLTHTHGVSGTTGSESNDHSHYVSGYTGSMNQNATHTHNSNAAANGGGSGTGGGAFALNAPGAATISAVNTDHQHYFAAQSGGISANHVHAFSVTSQASGDANEARPYSATVLTCIRVQ